MNTHYHDTRREILYHYPSSLPRSKWIPKLLFCLMEIYTLKNAATFPGASELVDRRLNSRVLGNCNGPDDSRRHVDCKEL